MAHPPDNRKALALVVLLTLLWGTNWALFPLVLREVSVWPFRAVNLVGGGLLLLAWSARSGVPLTVPRRHWPALVGAALAYLLVWNVATVAAAVLIPSGQAALLGYTMPAWTILLMWLWFGERVRPRMVAAVALSLAGVALLLVGARGSIAQAPLGIALGLLAALGWAAGTIILKRAAIQGSVLVITAWQLLIAAVPIVLVALLQAPSFELPSVPVMLLVAYITVVPIAIGNAVWFSIVGLLRPSVAGLSAVLVPVVAMLAGAVLHSEPLGPLQLAAMVCCAGAVLLAVRD